MNYAAATACPGFSLKWADADPALRSLASRAGFTSATTWAYVVPEEEWQQGLAGEFLTELFRNLGASESQLGDWMPTIIDLWGVASDGLAGVAMPPEAKL